MGVVVFFIFIFFLQPFCAYAGVNELPKEIKKINPDSSIWTKSGDHYVLKKYDPDYLTTGNVSYTEITYDAAGNKIKQREGNTATDSEGGDNSIMTGIVTILGWIVAAIGYAVGYILTVLISILLGVAQYNNIIDVKAVVIGWVAVRDLCNMFFVLILLVIAFATILRIENYQAKRLLPKLLIMAVLINFSKTIFGLIIDFSQVIMLTFVNGFSELGGSNFVTLFQIDKYWSLKNVPDEAFKQGSALAVLAGMLAGFIALLITTVVIIVMLGVLVMRIVMLWIYTILSPFVFLGRAFPGAQQYTERIFSDFIKQVMIGPLLAFFIWLALFTAKESGEKIGGLQTDISGTKVGSGYADDLGGLQGSTSKTAVNAFSDIFTSTNFQTYIITIALLIGGLMVTQQMGGAAGSMAGKGMGWIQKGRGLAARPIRERWSAFQGKREAARKEKRAAFGENLYSAYEGAKALGAGTFKGAGKAIDYGAKKMLGKKAGMAGGVAATVGAGAVAGAPVGIVLGSIMGGRALAKFGAGKIANWFRKSEDTKRAKFDAVIKGEKSDFLNNEGEAAAEEEADYKYHKESGTYLKKDAVDKIKEKDLDVRSLKYDKENKEWVGYNRHGEKEAGFKEDEVLTNKEGDLVEKHGRYEDKKGEYKYDENSNKYYKVNKKGEYVDEKGEVVTNLNNRIEAKGAGGKMGKLAQEVMKGWAEGRTKAWGMQAKATHEKIGKEIDKMQAAGISPQMMRSVLMDAGESKTKKLASALTLAIKEGFKGVDIEQAKTEVKEAKGLIGTNKLLDKQFNEAINKHFAHLNHDLSTEAGREEMKGAAADGDIDLTKQDASAYDTNMVGVMKDYFGKQFIPKLDDTAKASSAHRTSIVSALKETVKQSGRPLDDENKLDVNRVALANLSGDIIEAMKVKDNFSKDSEAGLASLIENAKIEHLAKIDVGVFDKEKHGDETVEKVKNIIGKNLSMNQFTGLERSRDATQKLKEEIDKCVAAVVGSSGGGESARPKITKKQYEKYKGVSGGGEEEEEE